MDVRKHIKKFNATLDAVSRDFTVPDYDDTSNVSVICNKPPCNHCDLTWTIIIDGRDVSSYIPECLRHSSMDTKNMYSHKVDESDDIEEYEYEETGYDEEDWIHINRYWLDTITTNTNIQRSIFQQIQSQEFTGCAECGGCI